MERLDFPCVVAGTWRIAIPLNLVLSVEEAGPLTPLPFNPELVEGLVMALGRVLPQMPLAAALNETSRARGVLRAPRPRAPADAPRRGAQREEPRRRRAGRGGRQRRRARPAGRSGRR